MQNALEESEAVGEKACVVGCDDKGVRTLANEAGMECEHRQRLPLQPVERGLANIGKLTAKALMIGGLVGRHVITNHHAIGVAAPHVGLQIVGGNAVAHAADASLDNAPLAGHLIGHFMPAVNGVAHGKLDQLGLAGGKGNRRSGFKQLLGFRRERKGWKVGCLLAHGFE